MATIATTYSEPASSGLTSKLWHLNIHGEDFYTYNSSTFVFETPPISVFYTPTDQARPYCRVRISADITIGGKSLFNKSAFNSSTPTGAFQWRNFSKTNQSAWPRVEAGQLIELTKYSYTSGEGSLTPKHIGILQTSDFFDSTNSNQADLPIVLKSAYSNYSNNVNYGRIYFASKSNSQVGDATNRLVYGDNSFNDIQIGTLVLKAPPVINSSSLTTSHPSGYPTSYCSTNKSTVSCSFNVAAQYGGNIKQIDFVLGDQYYRQTFNNNTTSYNSTFNIVPDKKGTFTPQLRILDSRGQITRKQFSAITVDYKYPTVNITNLQRTNGTTPDEENGTNATFTAKFTTHQGVKLAKPDVTITPSVNASTITWYSNSGFSSQVTFPTTSTTLYAKVETSTGLNSTATYNFKVTPKDENGQSGTAINTTLPPAYYTVDFRAGGHGIAFGQASVTDGFVCAMPTTFTGNSTVTFVGDANFTNTLKYKGSHVATNINFDSTNKKLTKTVNNTVTDIVTAQNFVAKGSGFQNFVWDDQTFYTNANNAQKTGWSIISSARITSSSASVQNMPSGNTSGGYWECYNMNDNFCNQFFYPRETTDTSFYWRKKASGNWGSWLEVQSGKKMNVNGEETSDLNNCKTAGFYTFTKDAAHIPYTAGGGVGGTLLVMRYSATYMYQIAFANSTNTSDSTTKDASQMRIYARRYYNGNWYPSNSWYKISMS